MDFPKVHRFNLRHRRDFQMRLRRWLRQNLKDYPWRKTRAPYRIFLAEFMLQRTGGQQVLRVYEKFVAKFPTVWDAAEAPDTELERILRPLGRTQRYRILARALSFVVDKLKGGFPRAHRKLEEIPGVGPYTARAIACFGFGQRLGLVDPTITRILERVFGIRSRLKRPHTDHAMWYAADALMPHKRVREFNLGMLDFGSVVCRRRKPRCAECPMNSFCVYWKERRSV